MESVATEPATLWAKLSSPNILFLPFKSLNLSACLLYLRILRTSGTVSQQCFSKRHHLFQEDCSPPCPQIYPQRPCPGSNSQTLCNAGFPLLFWYPSPNGNLQKAFLSAQILTFIASSGLFFSHLNQSCLLNYFRSPVKLCDRKHSSRVYIVLNGASHSGAPSCIHIMGWVPKALHWNLTAELRNHWTLFISYSKINKPLRVVAGSPVKTMAFS